MLLQQRQIPVNIYLNHISHFSELPFLEYGEREIMLCLQKVSKH